jgi:hypothetical protein
MHETGVDGFSFFALDGMRIGNGVFFLDAATPLYGPRFEQHGFRKGGFTGTGVAE